jgi:hypothetical protein
MRFFFYAFLRIIAGSLSAGFPAETQETLFAARIITVIFKLLFIITSTRVSDVFLGSYYNKTA